MEGIHLLRDLLLEGDWLDKLDLRRLLYHSNGQRTPTLPVRLEQSLSISGPTFQAFLCPMVLYQDYENYRLLLEGKRYLLNYIFGRHSHYVQRSLTDPKRPEDCNGSQSLGFIINREKSILTPSRSLEFLGFTVDTSKCLLLLPPKKIAKIRKEIRFALKQDSLTLRELARLLGLLSSSIHAIFPGPLNYRALQRIKGKALRSGLWYGDLVTLDQEARSKLSWWREILDAWNGKAIFGSTPEFVLESDASLHGWGARLLNQNTGGVWSLAETSHHINVLELTAGLYTLMSFRHLLQGRSVILKMDNISTVSYINCLGGTRSADLSNLAKRLWMFCFEHKIALKAEYLPESKIFLQIGTRDSS